MKDFRVLFLYPNLFLSSTVPQSMAILSAVLKEEGITTDLFDTTFYQLGSSNPNQEKVRIHNVKSFDFADRNIESQKTNVFDDFRKKVHEFKPDLIAVSFVEDTFYLGLGLLASIRELDIPVIAGGVFCTYAPEKVARQEDVDWVCRGEGEEVLVEVCRKLSEGDNLDDVQNLCYIEDGRVIHNPMRPPVDLNSLPLPDLSIFEDKSFYRPMTGKIYRTIGIETMRGCPYQCTFCNSSANNRLYRDSVEKSFFRKKDMRKVHYEINTLINKYKAEFIYFLADTFLLMTDAEFDAFVEIYSDFKIPFFMNTRAETVKEYRVKKLGEINCHRANIGLEHGNEKFRREVIGRSISNDAVIKAIKMVGDSTISTAANNIIGFPDETRKLVFDTIALNRRIKDDVDSICCFIFAPYHGTLLREIAVEKGYLDESVVVTADTTKESMLRMPQLTNEQLQGLQRTFCFYAQMPETEYPKIAIAERLDEEGNKMFEYLSDVYEEKYMDRKDSAEVC